MNDTLELEAEPFEMESTGEEFGQEEAGADFELTEETDGEFDQETETTAAAQRGRTALQRSQVQQALQRQRAHHTHFVKAIGALNKHVVKRDGLYRFTLPARTVSDAASKLRLPPQTVQVLLGSLKQKNSRLRAARTTQAELELEAPTCAGQTALKTYWWGQKIWLNECHSKTFSNALKAGAAAGGGCAAGAVASIVGTPVGIACAVVGTISGVSAYVIDAIDSLGGNQGIIVYRPWIGNSWVWHQ